MPEYKRKVLLAESDIQVMHFCEANRDYRLAAAIPWRDCVILVFEQAIEVN